MSLYLRHLRVGPEDRGKREGGGEEPQIVPYLNRFYKRVQDLYLCVDVQVNKKIYFSHHQPSDKNNWLFRIDEKTKLFKRTLTHNHRHMYVHDTIHVVY